MARTEPEPIASPGGPPSSRAVQILVALGLVVAGLAAVTLRHQRGGAQDERLRLEQAVGAKPVFAQAPAIELFDRAERTVPLASYRGRVVLVNFWATWCGPCKAEMPSMIALHAALDPADIAFVSIAEDDEWPPVDLYLQRSPLPFDVFRDRPPRVEEQFATKAYPTSFLIGRDGRVSYRFDGGRDWTSPDLLALLALDGVHRR